MIKQAAIFLMLAVLPAVLLNSCTSEQLEPDCNTQNISYSQDIVPILKSNCYKCHSAGNSVGSYGHLLDNYDSLTPLVRRDANTNISFLEGVITHTPGYIAMPYMDGKLDTCAIKQIQAWITQGHPNN
jgi:hypothetical protein